MARQLTESDGRIALRDHILEKTAAARTKHGPLIDDTAILKILGDRTIVRYPVGIRFDAAPLQAGEFAHPVAFGDHPNHGFCLFIHPVFEKQRDLWPLLFAYFIPPINYGDIADAEDCELFGASLLGLTVDSYYDALCSIADAFPPRDSG